MIGRILVLAAALVVACGGTASAHVSIEPKQATTRGFQEYVVRVPTEKDVPTLSVRMVFPEGFEVMRFRRVAGWTYELERDAKGRIVGVTWSGGKIAREEYELFSFMARASAPGTYQLNAYQTYQGNDVVGWENPTEPRPAPIVTIVAAPGTAGAAAPPPADPFAAAPAAATASESAAPREGATPKEGATPREGTSYLAAGMTTASLLIALASIVVSRRALQQSTRR
jgi:YD repeat-containing protein